MAKPIIVTDEFPEDFQELYDDRGVEAEFISVGEAHKRELISNSYKDKIDTDTLGHVFCIVVREQYKDDDYLNKYLFDFAEENRVN